MSMLFSHYGVDKTPQQIVDEVPVVVGSDGTDFGTLTQTLATWALSQGFDVEMVTSDFQIIDLSWAELDRPAMIAKLRQAKSARDIPNLGKSLSETYVQSYIDFLEAGGTLRIESYVDQGLLYEMLRRGPLHFCVAPSVLDGKGRFRLTGLRKTEPNDIDGSLSTHSVVVSGFTESGDFLISDPWEDRAEETISPVRLLTAFTASAYLCDNLFFQITPRR